MTPSYFKDINKNYLRQIKNKFIPILVKLTKIRQKQLEYSTFFIALFDYLF